MVDSVATLPPGGGAVDETRAVEHGQVLGHGLAFELEFGAKWPKAAAKIVDDVEPLLAFYDFSAERWIHLKTTNPISVRRLYALNAGVGL